jgi:hypothetical protein
MLRAPGLSVQTAAAIVRSVTAFVVPLEWCVDKSQSPEMCAKVENGDGVFSFPLSRVPVFGWSEQLFSRVPVLGWAEKLFSRFPCFALFELLVFVLFSFLHVLNS